MSTDTDIAIGRLGQLTFRNRFTALGSDFFSSVDPQPLRDARLLHFNAALGAEIGLDADVAGEADFVDVMAGNRKLDGGAYIASVYAGHQFGVAVGQLGDGRANLIGEVVTPTGAGYELQLKGAGQTPYSRFADGRAVLRSSVREYLCSEAMHGLGIPTTRALCLIGASDPVVRERIETAAVVCRVAPSFIRFGHFEYFYFHGQGEPIRRLADHVIDHHYPHLAEFEQRYAAWLTEVVERTALLMAQWQAVGFCHGVMNTDNMSILGLTLDYGPYGFLDGFDAHHICNHSDEGGRYAYDKQPLIGQWNCSRLLQATFPLLHETPDTAVEIANAILNRYPAAYTAAMMEHWRRKFGFQQVSDSDRELINRFLNLLDSGHSDFTRSFRALADVRSDDSVPALRDQIVDQAAFDAWLPDYRARLRQEAMDDQTRASVMRSTNPKYVLRNHLAQRAIERAEAADNSEIDRLFRLLQRPFDEQPEFEAYAAEPPAEARHISVSCSS
jgi:uncharacterized protein YdiU (UPF0061 family)